MMPPEYSAMRPYLARSSGFQGAQYRCIKFALGNQNAAMLEGVLFLEIGTLRTNL